VSGEGNRRAEKTMGQEAICVLKRGGEQHTGKALLETSEIIFRGKTLRLKIPFPQMKSVTAQVGELRIETAAGLVVFELGTAAEKWEEKILHPKMRIEKLGIKEGAKVVLLGEFTADFVRELREATKGTAEKSSKGQTDWIFLALTERKDLMKVGSASKKLKDAAGLWVVFPKGRKEIAETDVN
jgi:hypothetical protein